MFAINAKVQEKNGKARLIKGSLLKEHLNNDILKQEGNLKSISQSINYKMCTLQSHQIYKWIWSQLDIFSI